MDAGIYGPHEGLSPRPLGLRHCVRRQRVNFSLRDGGFLVVFVVLLSFTDGTPVSDLTWYPVLSLFFVLPGTGHIGGIAVWTLLGTAVVTL